MYHLIFLTCCLSSGAFASRCYSDICHNKTVAIDASAPQCLLTSIQRGKDCVNLRFDNLGLAPLVDEKLADFRLSAYVKDFGEFRGRATAFNLSIGDVKFNRLIIRYQDSNDYQNAACREIDIYGTKGEITFPEIFVSCPFADETFEGSPYRLEYLAVGEIVEYSRKLLFMVPKHASIDPSTSDVATFAPFFYVDSSNTATLALHIQPLPEEFNVTLYKVWLINNDTDGSTTLELGFDGEPEIRRNFSVGEGIYYFKVAAMHSICGDDGCINGTSPAISTKQPTRRLLIMIISVVWIPPVILYTMYYAYKLYVKNSLAKQQHRRRNCLLVYSPTHRAHIDVMRKLAIYMRSCNINAMIDVLDVASTADKDPGLWCDSAFRDADVIVVATSPPWADAVAPAVYNNVDNHALRLLKENYPRRNKRYFVAQFPYCERDDLPREARLFRRFDMPQELEKLVRNIYAVDRVRFFGVSSGEFAEAVKSAVREIPRRENKRGARRLDKNGPAVEATISDVLLTPKINDKGPNPGVDESNETKVKHDSEELGEYYKTNIGELNVLDDNVEREVLICKPQGNECRINRLDL